MKISKRNPTILLGKQRTSKRLLHVVFLLKVNSKSNKVKI